MASDARADILIADDVPANLDVLSAILKDAGYKVRAVPNGKLALQAATGSPPDIILLDIEMPELDGYETCTRLKADARVADVPVIFLSALSDASDKVKAFAAGGVDYVTKPFQAQEVLARVETHLRISRLQRQLETQFRDLKKLEELRDSLTHMIVHDLRSPLSGVLAYLQLMEMDAMAQRPCKPDDVQAAIRGARSLIQMISALLDVNKMEAGEMRLDLADTDLVTTTRAAIDSLRGLAAKREVQLDAPAPVPCVCDANLILRVIENLLGNAFRYSPEDRGVEVRVLTRDQHARVEVQDAGPGIPDEYRARIFEKFGRVESGRQHAHSTGLGLTFCKLAVEAHGGTIGVDSAVGDGSTFWFELPVARSGARP